MFARYCGSAGAGIYQADAVQTGITNMVCRRAVGSTEILAVYGNITTTSSDVGGAVGTSGELGKTMYSINQRMADRTRPENVALPVALYLGRVAQV